MVRAPSELAWTASMGDEYVSAWEMVMWMVSVVGGWPGGELVGMGWRLMEWERGLGPGGGVSGDVWGGLSVYVPAPSEMEQGRCGREIWRRVALSPPFALCRGREKGKLGKDWRGR